MKKLYIALAVLVLIGAGYYVIKATQFAPVSITIPEIYGYGRLSFFKNGNNLYLLHHSSFESEYNGMTYHVDLKEKSVNKIGSMFVAKENGKIIVGKTYDVDFAENYDSAGNFTGRTHNDAQLRQASAATGIPKGDLRVIGMGGKPWTFVMVRAEYDPIAKTINPTNRQIDPPALNYDTHQFELMGKVYPGPEFTDVGGLLTEDQDVTVSGIRFAYTEAARTLVITYKKRF